MRINYSSSDYWTAALKTLTQFHRNDQKRLAYTLGFDMEFYDDFNTLVTQVACSKSSTDIN